MVTEVNPLRFSNADSPIEVTPAGMTTLLELPKYFVSTPFSISNSCSAISFSLSFLFNCVRRSGVRFSGSLRRSSG